MHKYCIFLSRIILLQDLRCIFFEVAFLFAEPSALRERTYFPVLVRVRVSESAGVRGLMSVGA